MSSRDAVVVGAVRTPIGVGKPGKGNLGSVHPVDLSAHVIRELVARTGVDPAVIEDVVWGYVSQVGEQAFNIARNSALAAGLPESVVGTTVDRQCGSSQQSVQFVAAGVVAGHYDVAIAGGVESMSRVPMFSNVGDADPFASMRTQYDDALVPQGVSAERGVCDSARDQTHWLGSFQRWRFSWPSATSSTSMRTSSVRARFHTWRPV